MPAREHIAPACGREMRYIFVPVLSKMIIAGRFLTGFKKIRKKSGRDKGVRNRLWAFWVDLGGEGCSPAQVDGPSYRTTSRHHRDNLAERSDGWLPNSASVYGAAVNKLGQAPRSYAKSLHNADIRSEPVPFFHSLGAFTWSSQAGRRLGSGQADNA